MRHHCAQPMRVKLGMASTETTLLRHLRDVGELPSSGTHRIICSCLKCLSRAACWFRSRAQAMSTIFRNAELVFQFNTAMRFTDKTLVEILQVMRTPGGRKLCRYQWQALLQTERSAEQPAADAAQSDDIATWYHVCCCWSVITMASFMLARVSARKAGQTLYYVQAVDQPLTVLLRASQEDFYEELLRISSIQITKRLPAVVLWHLGMRMRFSTTLQQPLAVQDVGCTVLGFEPDDMDKDAQVATDAHNCQGEHVCCYMPKAIYVKIDDCTCHFLPLAPCFTHRTTGHDASCLDCISAVQPGIFAVKPLARTFRYHYDAKEKSKYINGQRKQFPLIPALAMPLYSMQGHYGRPWHGRILVLPAEMQPDGKMAHRLCHAVSAKRTCVSPVSRSY